MLYIKIQFFFLLSRCRFATVNEWEGETLEIARISRLDMGAYLCIASNGVPPSVSKRIKVSVDCEYGGECWMPMSIDFSTIFCNKNNSCFACALHFFLGRHIFSSADGLDSTSIGRHTNCIQCDIRVFHRSSSDFIELLVEGIQ